MVTIGGTSMRKVSILFLIAMFVAAGLSLGSLTAIAADEKAPAAPAEVAAPAANAAAEAAPAENDAAVDDLAMPEEELEDVKILKEAAAKLKASDPELAAKLEALAEDYSW